LLPQAQWVILRRNDVQVQDLGLRGDTQLKNVIQVIEDYLPTERVNFIRRAYHFAETAHEGQVRLSGEPFINHPVETALYLAQLRMDSTTIAAALLHDVIEDCDVTNEELEAAFGPDVTRLVDGVTKLNRLDQITIEDRKTELTHTEHAEQAEDLRKLLVAMAQDLRVILIKLADRLHNMRTLRYLPKNRRISVAQETMDIYAPLAHRLGMWDIKYRLEDIAFKELDPKNYREVASLVAKGRGDRERYITQVANTLAAELREHGIEAKVTGRAKHLYSIHQKIQSYALQNKDFNDIYDLFALRVLVDHKDHCYTALGVLHSLWTPLPTHFDDYVAKPKENLYQSLHTTVVGPAATPLEVQIRTHEMHRIAEYGVASHWLYKEGQEKASPFEANMNWVRQLLDWQREVSGPEEFIENVKTDLLHDQVFVYTPKGDVKELPVGSTSIDFAYRVHTELGHRCIGAKINGKLTALNTALENGDTVEIITSKVPRGPSLDWLNLHAGYVRSAAARQRIRLWFRRRERSENVQRGKELLSRELRRLDLTPTIEQVTRLFNMNSAEELFYEFGSGNVPPNDVLARLNTIEPVEGTQLERQDTGTGLYSGIEVVGVGDLVTVVAKCCSPLPGDDIIGYITRNEGVSIHRAECKTNFDEDGPQRFIQVNWGARKNLYPVYLILEAWDRVGLLRDVTTHVSEERVNIASLKTRDPQEGIAIMDLTVFTTDVNQLGRLFAKLEEVKGIINVSRINTHNQPSPRVPKSETKTM